MSSVTYEEIFGAYKLSSHEPLIGLKRSKCKKCGGSRMYFCYKCHSYVSGIDESKMPRMRLPWKVDIIKHAKEVDGKSTAIHAALLAPDDVKIYTYPTIPNYCKDDKILLVFPDKKASTMASLFGNKGITTGEKRSNSENTCDVAGKRAKTVKDEICSTNVSVTTSCNSKLFEFKKIIFIDCTWGQAYGIFTDERLKDIATVKLSSQTTVYWRHNEEMPYTFLATIEAIYSFLKDSHEIVYGEYDQRYDDMLYFYSYFYKLVQEGMQKRKISQKNSGKSSKTCPNGISNSAAT